MAHKSNYSYYCIFPERKISVCANFLTEKLTVFQKDAYNLTREYIERNNFHEIHGRGYELLQEAGFFKTTEDEEKELENRKKAIRENKGRLSITIFITDKCNFRCKYCCQERIEHVLSEETQVDLLNFLDDFLPRYDRLFIEWFGGEPLLYPDIIIGLSSKIIELCRKYGVHYNSHITTNGYLLNANLIKLLRKYLVLSYQITLDGIRETHDKQRVLSGEMGTWDHIVDNLIDIRDHVHTPTISIMIRTNITKEIYKNKEKYLLFLKDTFDKDQRFHFLWKLAEDWGNMEPDDKNMLCGLEEYQAVVSMANDLGLKTRFLRETITMGGRMCEAGKKNNFILYADGSIGKCARRLNPEINIIADSKELVNKGEKIIGTYLNGKVGYCMEKCTSCVKKPLCLSQICPMETITDCGYEMSNIDFLLESIATTDDRCIFKNS